MSGQYLATRTHASAPLFASLPRPATAPQSTTTLCGWGCGSRARQRRAQSGRGREANPLQIGMSAGGPRPKGASPGCSIPVNGLPYGHSAAVVIGLVSGRAPPNDEAIRLLGRCLPVYEAADARMPTAVCCSERPAVLACVRGWRRRSPSRGRASNRRRAARRERRGHRSARRWAGDCRGRARGSSLPCPRPTGRGALPQRSHMRTAGWLQTRGGGAAAPCLCTRTLRFAASGWRPKSHLCSREIMRCPRRGCPFATISPGRRWRRWSSPSVRPGCPLARTAPSRPSFRWPRRAPRSARQSSR